MMRVEKSKIYLIDKKYNLIKNNVVPDYFLTKSNKNYEWIWLPNSNPNQLLAIRNADHVLLNMRGTSPISMNTHIKFLEVYELLPRIDFILVDKDNGQYVGGINLSLTRYGFEVGQYIGNSAYLGKGVGFQMSRSFITYVKENFEDIKKIYAVTRRENFKYINLNIKLGFKTIRPVESYYLLMSLDFA